MLSGHPKPLLKAEVKIYSSNFLKSVIALMTADEAKAPTVK